MLLLRGLLGMRCRSVQQVSRFRKTTYDCCCIRRLYVEKGQKQCVIKRAKVKLTEIFSMQLLVQMFSIQLLVQMVELNDQPPYLNISKRRF